MKDRKRLIIIIVIALLLIHIPLAAIIISGRGSTWNYLLQKEKIEKKHSRSEVSGNDTRGEDVEEGLVRLANDHPLGSLDVAKNAEDYYVALNVFDRLLEEDTEEGTHKIRPSLAKEWKVSDDGKTYSFTLRDDVYFSDGTKLTSEDVKVSFSRLLSVENSEQVGYANMIVGAENVLAGRSDTLSGIEIIDDTHFDIKLTVYADDLKRIRPLYIDYLQKQTESVVKVEGIAQGIQKGGLPDQVGVKKLNKGSVIPIEQAELQTSGNGCWSVAFSNMLQSQGIKLTQQEIRAYRQMKDPLESGRLSDDEAKILFCDEVANPFEKRDLLHKLLPGKAMQELEFTYTEEDDYETQLNRAEDFLKKHIKEAIDVHHSPVAMLVGGHYRTIVGYDGDRILYKDSLQHKNRFGNPLPPDSTYNNLTFRELAQDAIDPTKQVVLDTIIDVDKVPDVEAAAAYEASNPDSYAFINIATGVPGISMKFSHAKQVDSKLMRNVPEEMKARAQAAGAAQEQPAVQEAQEQPAVQEELPAAPQQPEVQEEQPEVQKEQPEVQGEQPEVQELPPQSEQPAAAGKPQENAPKVEAAAAEEKQPEEPLQKAQEEQSVQTQQTEVQNEQPVAQQEQPPQAGQAAAAGKPQENAPKAESEEPDIGPEIIRSGNVRLDDAINDVGAVYGRFDGMSEEFTRVNTMASNLRHATEQFYESGRNLTDKDIDVILQHYDNLLKACDDYLKSVKSNMDKGYDMGRSYCVRALRGIVVEDMRALNESMGVSDREKTLLEAVQKGRTIQAVVDRPGEIKTVGGSMSTRMPIRLKCEDGSIEEGFFTESQVLEDYTKRMQRLKKETLEKYGEDSAEYRIAKAVCIEDRRTMVDTYSSRFDHIMALADKSIIEDLSDKPGVTRDVLNPFFNRLDKDIQDRLMDYKKIEETVPLRKFLLNMTYEASNYAGVFHTNNYHAGIPVGERMDKRNTAMSTVANYLGMGKIIAGARNFEVRIGNEIKHGTFQQKASGTDIDRVIKGDEIEEIGKAYKPGDYSAVDTLALKHQLSDLMALDYICGNTDRHIANMLYRTGKDKDGKVVITGIKGIDNDMSFGKKTVADNSSQEKMVNPEDMRIMRRTTAQRVLDLTPEKLYLMLKDMDFTKGEKEACHRRLSTLQDKLKKDMAEQSKTGDIKIRDGKIVVVPDEKFKDYTIDELGTPGKGKEATNYFERAKVLPRHLNKDLVQHKQFAKEKDVIRYVDATATSGNMNFVNEDVRVDVDIEAMSDRLGILKQNFDRMGNKWFTKDTGHFQWMKQSLGQMSDKFFMLKSGTYMNNSSELTKADAVKFEAFLRQVRIAATNYAATHPSPITPSGKARRKMALELMNLKPVYKKSEVWDMKAATAQKEVKRTDIGRLMKQEGSVKKKTTARKEPAKDRKAVRNRSKSVNNRNNMSL